MIARSATPAPSGVLLKRGDWVANKAGLTVSKFYGFGLMNAGKMVHLAKQWRRVPPQLGCEMKGQHKSRFVLWFTVKFSDSTWCIRYSV